MKVVLSETVLFAVIVSDAELERSSERLPPQKSRINRKLADGLHQPKILSNIPNYLLMPSFIGRMKDSFAPA